MRKRRWTKEQLAAAAKDSRSIRQVLDKIGLVAAGGNYKQIKEAFITLNISTEHFLGRGWCKGRKTPMRPALPLDKILTKNSTYQSYKLKNRLFNSGIKAVKCELCGWAEHAPSGHVPLELDHINGDASDNRLENLRILCPNCHSLTPTYRSRKRQS